MPLSVNTNIASLSAQRSLSSSQGALETASMPSTGKRINSAVDDAAGLAISTTWDLVSAESIKPSAT